MIHRGTLGAMERLVAYLLERYDGGLPVWLSPVQVVLLPVAAGHAGPAGKLLQSLLDNGIRAELDAPDDTLAARVRRAATRRVPYQVVLGDREIAGDRLAVRTRDGRSRELPAADLLAELTALIRDRR
jgi:threonyl-tRNA synthetase